MLIREWAGKERGPVGVCGAAAKIGVRLRVWLCALATCGALAGGMHAGARPATAPPPAVAAACPTPLPRAARAAGADADAVRSLLAGLRLVNYFPSRHPWARMWTAWDPESIDADFARIAALHATAVRVALQAWAIGYPRPAPAMLGRLSRIIALADRHGLRVQLTLFDWWSSYDDLAGSRAWACAVLAPYAGDRRVAFVELKNEPDPGDPRVAAWLRAMVPFVRTAGGGIPVALSAFRQESVAALARDASPDLLSFHVLAGAERAYATLLAVQRASAPLPLYVGEAGTSTYAPLGVLRGCTSVACSEAYQEHRYRTVQYAARLLGLPAVAPWTLNDFAPGAIPASVPESEYHFGLFRTDGRPKAVAGTVARYFATGALATAFNGGFEAAAGEQPAEWQRYHDWQGHFARDTSVAHGGLASARLGGSASDASGGPAFFLSPIAAGVRAGRVYRLSAWVRGRAASGETRLALAWFDRNDRYLGQIQSPPLPHGTTGWRLLRAAAAAPPGAVYVQIHCKSFDNRGTAWFDDVSFG